MNQSFKTRVIFLYCIIFYLLMIYKIYNGSLMIQIQPAFFYNREDIFTWVFMQRGLHQWLLYNFRGWLVADLLFYAMPVLYLLTCNYVSKIAPVVAFLMLIINMVYVQCYTLYPTNSIEGYIGWLLFPVVFIPATSRGFNVLFSGLRYVFIYLFFSAAIWKVAQGGIFNLSQMSGILLEQHQQLIAGSAHYWQTRMYLWLIEHETVSYLFYLAAFLIELIFIIGFFTKKYDRWLAALFLLFLVSDHVLMRITYYDLLPLVLTLLLKDNTSNSHASTIAI